MGATGPDPRLLWRRDHAKVTGSQVLPPTWAMGPSPVQFPILSGRPGLEWAWECLPDTGTSSVMEGGES